MAGLVAVSVIGVFPVEARSQDAAIVLRTSRVLDGRGGVLEDRDLVIRGGEIVEIVPAMAKRRAGDPHPYVIGQEGVSRFLTVAEECATAGPLW